MDTISSCTIRVNKTILVTNSKIAILSINPTRGSIWNASRVAGGAFEAPPPYKNQFIGHFDPIFYITFIGGQK